MYNFVHVQTLEIGQQLLHAMPMFHLPQYNVTWGLSDHDDRPITVVLDVGEMRALVDFFESMRGSDAFVTDNNNFSLIMFTFKEDPDEQRPKGDTYLVRAWNGARFCDLNLSSTDLDLLINFVRVGIDLVIARFGENAEVMGTQMKIQREQAILNVRENSWKDFVMQGCSHLTEAEREALYKSTTSNELEPGDRLQ